MQNDITVKSPTDIITVALSPRQLDLLANVLEDMEEEMNEDGDKGLEPVLASDTEGRWLHAVDLIEELKVGVLGHIAQEGGSSFTFVRSYWAWYDEAMEVRWRTLKGVLSTPAEVFNDEATNTMKVLATREMDEITTLASTMLTAMGVTNDGPAWRD